jgi:predicted regulator of Ras-like GTPase activity (Roadblock/LC7/MglB family)
MKLPAGTDGGVITNLQDEGLIQHLMTLRGAIEIDTVHGHGFLLTDRGNLAAAFFADTNNTYRGKTALEYLMGDANKTGMPTQTFSLKNYNETEFADALAQSTEEHLLLSLQAPEPVSDDIARQSPAHPDRVHASFDEAVLQKLLSQPGIIAASAFFEGFPVLSRGNADFEHIAALAEDLMRAGRRIAKEMSMGSPNQLILETEDNKIIIAPCGDLFLCIVTKADAQLGLLRVLLKSIQMEMST